MRRPRPLHTKPSSGAAPSPEPAHSLTASQKRVSVGRVIECDDDSDRACAEVPARRPRERGETGNWREGVIHIYFFGFDKQGLINSLNIDTNKIADGIESTFEPSRASGFPSDTYFMEDIHHFNHILPEDDKSLQA